MKRIGVLLLFFAFFLSAFQIVHARDAHPRALVLTADGPVSATMREYIKRGIQIAEQQGDEVLIIRLNTPGGSISIMNEMVQIIRASRVPVVVYVSPRGAWAGSAGTLITLAGHVAAMAPETAIGAASPVGGEGEDLGDTMEAKVKEITKATARTLAERRGPKAVQLAEDTIETARAVSSSEALEAGLIDFVAADVDDLLTQMDGFEVQMIDGPRALHTTGAIPQDLPLSLVEQLLLLLSNPNIVFLLLTIGVQAILIELSSPGGWVSGFIGAVCLVLAFYGMGVLNVNWFGLLFMAISFVLFILDIKAPTHGALTTAGVACFIIGALVLFNSPGTPQFERVSLPLVILTGLVMGLFFMAIMLFALRAQRAPIRMGVESIAGQGGIAKTDVGETGQVQVGSELWSAEPAEGSGKIRKGDAVEVVKVEGLRLKVRRKE
jgi:membrane-bound serine protease (ClpP class)